MRLGRSVLFCAMVGLDITFVCNGWMDENRESGLATMHGTIVKSGERGLADYVLYSKNGAGETAAAVYCSYLYLYR